ncbi:MAG: GNAT family N-acetyltransferase [Myxococcota bacterium]
MSAPAAFRLATADDVPAIVALLSDDVLGRTRESAPDDPLYARAFAEIEANPIHELWVAVAEDGTLIGCLQLSFLRGLSRRAALRALIEGVRVKAGARGQGLGRWFIGEAIARARARGASLVQLTTDKSRVEAHRFYESLGFAATHEGMKMKLE